MLSPIAGQRTMPSAGTPPNKTIVKVPKGAIKTLEGVPDMALFPIIGRFVGDFVPHLVAIDTEDTFDQIAEKVAVHSVGRRLPPNPASRGYEVLLEGKLLDGREKFECLTAKTPVLPLQWFDVRWKQ
jgi:Toluene-4-monooxygenase system protein B (TmoB)